MSSRVEDSQFMKRKAELETKAKRTDAEEKELESIKELLKKKIISVTMSQSLVNRIDDLVQERVGRSRAQLIEDSVRWFLDFSVHKWNERGVYVNSSRAVFESESLSSLFFSKLTPTDQYDLGVTAGSQSPIADVVRLYHGGDPADVASHDLVLGLLQDTGWGSISLNQGLIVLGSPFYPAPFIRGYLESLLKVNLEVVETTTKENVALRIK